MKPVCGGTIIIDSAFQDESDPIETTFELNETLYAKANIPPTEEVYIWLGVCAILLHSCLARLTDLRPTSCSRIPSTRQRPCWDRSF